MLKEGEFMLIDSYSSRFTVISKAAKLGCGSCILFDLSHLFIKWLKFCTRFYYFWTTKLGFIYFLNQGYFT